MVTFLHTWYAISDIERSLHFYEAFEFEERGRVEADDKQLHIVLGLPTEAEPRLVLTYEEDVDHYDLGNGYRRIVLEAPDFDSTLERLAQAGIHPDAPMVRLGGPESPPYCGFRDPDGYRVWLIGDRNVEAAGNGGSRARKEDARSRRRQSASESPEIALDDETLETEEAARRRQALDPDTNRVLPRSREIGKEGVEALWNERPPQYPMVRHNGNSESLLRVRVRPEKDIGKWLRNGRHRVPKLVKQGPWWFETPFAWLEEITAQLADQYGGVLVIRDEASIKDEKCAPACTKAKSPVTSCQCSCGGLYHGTEALPVGFHVISEALAVRISKTEEVSITFIKPRNASERRRMGLR